jgi:hypothetical protein
MATEAAKTESDAPRTAETVRAIARLLWERADEIEKGRGPQALTIVIKFANGKPRTILFRPESKIELVNAR